MSSDTAVTLTFGLIRRKVCWISDPSVVPRSRLSLIDVRLDVTKRTPFTPQRFFVRPEEQLSFLFDRHGEGIDLVRGDPSPVGDSGRWRQRGIHRFDAVVAGGDRRGMFRRRGHRVFREVPRRGESPRAADPRAHADAVGLGLADARDLPLARGDGFDVAAHDARVGVAGTGRSRGVERERAPGLAPPHLAPARRF